MLRSFAADNQRNWDKYLQKVACALRTAKHEVTGLTPYFINFGREALLLGTSHATANDDSDKIEFERDRARLVRRACNFRNCIKTSSNGCRRLMLNLKRAMTYDVERYHFSESVGLEEKFRSLGLF